MQADASYCSASLGKELSAVATISVARCVLLCRGPIYDELPPGVQFIFFIAAIRTPRVSFPAPHRAKRLWTA
jgi:hypothetical protein